MGGRWPTRGQEAIEKVSDSGRRLKRPEVWESRAWSHPGRVEELPRTLGKKGPAFSVDAIMGGQ